MSRRADMLAQRIEQGAEELATLAERLSDADWKTTVPPDGRTVGVMIHHVASVYPIEVDLARKVATGTAVSDLSWADVAKMNRQHARDHAGANKKETVALLRANAKAAAAAVRALTDKELDTAAPFSLNADAPLSAQFVIEDHALRHSFHHLAKIKAALKR